MLMADHLIFHHSLSSIFSIALPYRRIPDCRRNFSLTFAIWATFTPGIMIDQFHAGSNPSEDGNFFHPDLYDDAFRGDHHDFVVVIHRLDSHNISGLLRDLIALHAFSAAMLQSEFVQGSPLSHAVF